jgi:predicted small lipoprotein YifL
MGRLVLTMVLILPLVLGSLGCGKKAPPILPPDRTQAAAGVSR